MKQYNLLRPINLNELIVGMQILFVSNQHDRREQLETVVALANDQNYFVTQSEKGTFYIVPVACYYHNPLTWIEDKPVYKGDILWYKHGKWSMQITGYNPRTKDKSGFEGIIAKGDGDYNIRGDVSWIPFGNWTWTPCLEKKQGWINIYKNHKAIIYRWDTYQDAFDNRRHFGYITTIQIEWEE